MTTLYCFASSHNQGHFVTQGDVNQRFCGMLQGVWPSAAGCTSCASECPFVSDDSLLP